MNLNTWNPEQEVSIINKKEAPHSRFLIFSYKSLFSLMHDIVHLQQSSSAFQFALFQHIKLAVIINVTTFSLYLPR